MRSGIPTNKRLKMGILAIIAVVWGGSIVLLFGGAFVNAAMKHSEAIKEITDTKAAYCEIYMRKGELPKGISIEEMERLCKGFNTDNRSDR